MVEVGGALYKKAELKELASLASAAELPGMRHIMCKEQKQQSWFHAKSSRTWNKIFCL